MKHIRFELPVLAPSDVPVLLAIACQVDGVIAASVHENRLEVVAVDVDVVPFLRAELRDAYAEGDTIPA